MDLQKSYFSSINFIFVEKGIREHAAFCLKQQFKECLGIDLQLKPMPWNKLFNSVTKGDFQIGLLQWISWVDDPIYTLNTLRSQRDEMNFAKWENSQFQDLVKMGEQEINPFQRSSYLHKAEEILSQELPLIPLFSYSHHALIAKDLHIHQQTPCGAFQAARSYFKKREN